MATVSPPRRPCSPGTPTASPQTEALHGETPAPAIQLCHQACARQTKTSRPTRDTAPRPDPARDAVVEARDCPS
eukprot:6489583-Amphidinium_carterae.1